MRERASVLGLVLLLTGCNGTETDNPATPVPLPDVARSPLAYDSAPVVAPETQTALLGDLNEFGLRLLRQLAPSDQNLVLSPASGFFALTMTSAGALGVTAEEMRTVLYPHVSLGEIHAATNQLAQRIQAYARPSVATQEGEKKVELSLVNDDFAQKGFPIEQPFLDTLAVNYDCGVELVDYADPEFARTLINNWVAQATRDRIPEVLPAGSLDPNTTMVLVNALRLYASWKAAFATSLTQPGTFHGVSGDGAADFMQGEVEVNYATGSGWVAVDLPYWGDQLVFTAVLPDTGQFETVKAGVDTAWLANLDAASTTQNVQLTLPKFELAAPTVSWSAALEALGMSTLFVPGVCNLGGINPTAGLFVQDVFQQAFLALDEAGTEAAAATAVAIGRLALVPTVVLDRPFLFLLRERGGPVLFTGQIVALPVAGSGS